MFMNRLFYLEPKDARISQAQIGLRRDLGMVWEFAMNIERHFFFFHICGGVCEPTFLFRTQGTIADIERS
jgi:hypothetical protein